MDGRHGANSIIVDQIADALNFHIGVTDSVVSNTFVRNSGDDGLAMWSERVPNAGNMFDRNTVQTPTLANGIAIYGGTDTTVSNNLVADPIREGSGCTPDRGSARSRSPGRSPSRTTRPCARAPTSSTGTSGSARSGSTRSTARSTGRHPGDRRPLPRQHLQRDHDGVGLAGEGPVLDHGRALRGRPGRRHGNVGGQRPRRPARRRSRTSTPATSARSA